MWWIQIVHTKHPKMLMFCFWLAGITCLPQISEKRALLSWCIYMLATSQIYKEQVKFLNHGLPNLRLSRAAYWTCLTNISHQRAELTHDIGPSLVFSILRGLCFQYFKDILPKICLRFVLAYCILIRSKKLQLFIALFFISFVVILSSF